MAFLTIPIPDKMEERFESLAREKNQAKDEMILDALEEFLVEQEGVKAADEVMADIRAGRDIPSNLEAVVRRLGLEN